MSRRHRKCEDILLLDYARQNAEAVVELRKGPWGPRSWPRHMLSPVHWLKDWRRLQAGIRRERRRATWAVRNAEKQARRRAELGERYELWLHEDEEASSYSFFPTEGSKKNRALLEPGATLVRVFYADSWDEACEQRNGFLGWAPYVPMPPPCCANERRSMDGGCESCGAPSY